jgi:hypothetical protein
VTRSLASVALALLAFLSLAAPSPAACRVRPHARVVLFGTGGDPGVLLWDSRFRLRAYHLATFDEAQAMLPRALLVTGGTRAVVLRCMSNFVQARYGLGLDNALEVRVLTGRLRGTTGWVAGSDARKL